MTSNLLGVISIVAVMNFEGYLYKLILRNRYKARSS
jgi:hypothetical protein